MEVLFTPSRSDWSRLTRRATMDVSALFGTVRTVLDAVRAEGDAAVKRYEEQFDKVQLESLIVSDEEKEEAYRLVPDALKDAIRRAASNIRTFHAPQRFTGQKVETTPGVVCWQKAVPLEKVGLYVPGGSAPLFPTALMLAVPA